jgi:hypothetical protein
MTPDEYATKLANQLLKISTIELSNAKILASSCVAEYFISNRKTNAADLLIPKFKDMPVHNPTASFIFAELEFKVLRC